MMNGVLNETSSYPMRPQGCQPTSRGSLAICEWLQMRGVIPLCSESMALPYLSFLTHSTTPLACSIHSNLGCCKAASSDVKYSWPLTLLPKACEATMISLPGFRSLVNTRSRLYPAWLEPIIEHLTLQQAR